MSKFHSLLTLALASMSSFVLGGAVVYLTWQPAGLSVLRPAADVMATDASKPPAEDKTAAVAEPKLEPKPEPKASAEEKQIVAIEPKLEPKPEPKPSVEEKPIVLAEPQPEPKPRLEPQPEPKAALKPSQSALQAPLKAEPTLESKSKPKAEDMSVARRSYGIGREASAQEIAGWDIDVRPDGQGLPPGSGTARQGEEIYMTKCAACHGEFGEGAARWPPVAGGRGTLSSHDPHKTVGSYFPYVSTVFDYVRHTMPFGDAQSLSNDELYALVAYMLYLNSLVEEDFVLSKETWTSVKMPNESGFIHDDRETTEKSFWNPSPCMTNCKDDVKITGRARVIDVTPEEKPK